MQKSAPAPTIAPQEAMFDDVRSYVQDCLDTAATDTVSNFALSGDLRNVELERLEGMTRAVFKSENDVPSMDLALRMIREEFLNQIEVCYMDLPFNYDIKASSLQANITYGDGKLTFYTFSPMQISAAGRTRKVFGFASQVQYQLDHYLESGKEAVKAITMNPPYINISALNRIGNRYTLGHQENGRYDVSVFNGSNTLSSYSFVVEVP